MRVRQQVAQIRPVQLSGSTSVARSFDLPTSAMDRTIGATARRIVSAARAVSVSTEAFLRCWGMQVAVCAVRGIIPALPTFDSCS